MKSIFHLAFKVKDIASTKEFYNDILGCPLGRETDKWVDFDFFGHQLSAHVSKNIPVLDFCGLVDGVKVPIPHFGCVLSEYEFEKLNKNLIKHQVNFLVEPQTRYEGLIGEQKTMFVLDFSENALEFKCFKNEDEVFL